MAFGRPKTDTEGTPRELGEKRFFRTMFLPVDTGARRVVRLLTDWQDPEYPEKEVISSFVWLEVTVGDRKVKRKVYVDQATKKNVIPEWLHAKTLTRCYMNVLDLSSVIVTDTDPNDATAVQLSYVQDNGKYYTNYKREEEVKGKGVTNSRIMLFEAPYAFLSGAEGQAEILTNDEGNPLNLLDMTLTFVSRIDEKTKKPVIAVSGQQYTGKRDYYDLPRYDRKLIAPWPADAVQELLDGRDYGDVVKEYSITIVPQLITKDSVEEEPF